MNDCACGTCGLDADRCVCEPDCPSEQCKMCNGEACNKCGAGCWNNAVKDCEHDVSERHEEHEEPEVTKVVTIYETNFRDVAATLRAIADEVEAGKYGAVGCAGVTLLGDRMHVFGMGPESEAPAVALLLHAGFSSMSRAIEDHGK